MPKRTQEPNTRFESWLEKGAELLGFGASWLASLRRKAGRQAEGFARRVGLRFLLQAWVSLGLLLSLLGIMELIISAGFARGLVWALGGALIAMTALLIPRVAGQMGAEDE